jgi:DNA-binding MurR/RpiR family transcriptional regulator
MTQTPLTRLEKETTQMTPALRRVADYILKNPVDTSFMTLEQLSQQAGASTATVMRVAFQLGYSGYSDFQRDLQELLRDRVAPTTRLEVSKKSLKHSSVLNNCAENHIDNVKSMMDFLTKDVIDESVGLIAKAKKIYIVGVRSSFAIAYYLHQTLNQITGNCVLLEAGSGNVAEEIINITRADLVIGITMPRYARPTVETLRLVKQFGPKIIVITDGYGSPLAPLADVLLPCSVRSLAFHNSIAGPALLVDFLITSFALAYPQRTRDRLDTAEPVLKQMNILMDE